MTGGTITPDRVTDWSGGTITPDRDLVGDWSAALAADYYARRSVERPGGCTCRECVTVDHLPGARLREASAVAEYTARRIEVLG